MQTGDIVIVAFPFTNLAQAKARPAVVAAITDDKYQDIVVCMISSVVPSNLTAQQIQIQPSKSNQLRATSVIKVGRIITIEPAKIVTTIGKLDAEDCLIFKNTFKSLVD